MLYVLGAAALVAVIVAAISVLRRPSAEDISSVRHYHSALGTLEHLSEQNVRPVPPVQPFGDDRDAGAQPRFYRRPDATGPLPAGVGVAEAEGARGAEGDVEPPSVVPPAPPRSSGPVPPVSLRDSTPDPAAALVFDDARPRDRYAPDRPGLPQRSNLDRAQRHALDSMNRRPRRGVTLTVVAAAVVVLFTVLAVVGSQRSAKHNSGASTRGSTPTTVHPTASTVSGRTNRHRTTSTTAPSQLVAQSFTPGSALYTVGPSSYRLTLAASGPCWVNATSQSTGSTLWTGTMQSGATQDIQATGTTRIEFGTLAVAVTLDGATVQIPSAIRSPFSLTFEPSTSASTSTSASASASASASTPTSIGPSPTSSTPG